MEYSQIIRTFAIEMPSMANTSSVEQRNAEGKTEILYQINYKIMKGEKWDENRLRKDLDDKLLFEYEQYKNYTVDDLLIDYLNDETIFDYTLLDEVLFFNYFTIEIDEEWINGIQTFTKRMVTGKPFDDFSNSLKSREVRIKVMFFIHQNAEKIWRAFEYCSISDTVKKECARIINKNITEYRNDDYAGMPRPDFKKLIYDPNFLKEKTPSRRWREEQIKNVEDAIQTINTPVQEEAEEQMIVEQPLNEEQPVEVNKSEEEVNHVEENDFPAEAVPQEVPDSVIFNTSYWKPDDCKKEFKHIINACPEKRGKQMVIKKIREQSSYFYCNSLRHKQFAEELNRLQSKFKFTKADVATAFRRE